MNKKLIAVRGAVCCENTKEDITEAVCSMFNEIVTVNKLCAEDIVSVHFTITKEITVLNPATALRIGKPVIDTSELALFCSQEAFIEGGMKNVIRVMITSYADENIKKQNVYLNGAEKLRPDFSRQK